MRAVPLIAAILLSFSSAFAGEIREFDVPTVERLGRELYHRDHIAAVASDMVRARYPKSKPEWRGWVTELTDVGDRVYIVTDGASGPMQGYVVMFPKSGEPRVEDRRNDPLPPNMALRYKARNTAVEAAKPKLFPVDNYNFEVLDDPDGSGFLVYGLAYSKKIKIMLGGHLRVTVSADGEKAERVDALSHTILPDPPAPKGYKGQKPIGVSMSQIVSNRPLETSVYTSLHDKIIVFVGMMDGTVWTAVGDKIYRTDNMNLDKPEAKSAKTKTKVTK